jgi:hypothetical protein
MIALIPISVLLFVVFVKYYENKNGQETHNKILESFEFELSILNLKTETSSLGYKKNELIFNTANLHFINNANIVFGFYEFLVSKISAKYLYLPITISYIFYEKRIVPNRIFMLWF